MKPYYSEDGITLFNADCREVLADRDVLFDGVLTDPPYNVGFNYELGDDARPQREYLRWLGGIFEGCATQGAMNLIWFWQGIRVANGQARAVIPKDWHIHHLAAWFKREFAGDLWKGGHPAFTWEPIIWAARFDPRFAGPRGGHEGRDGLIGNSSRHDNAVGHPCPKTESIVKTVVSWLDSEKICDPFCGSGTTLVAAKACGKMAIGIEISEKYCEIAAKRLAQKVLDFK